MTKKINKEIYIDDFDDDFEDLNDEMSDDEMSDDVDISDDEMPNNEMSDDVDISDDDVEMSDVDFDIKFKSSQNKHKSDGKHSLKRDTIFNGKLEEKPEDNLYVTDVDFYDIYPTKIKSGTNFEFESRYNEEYVNNKELELDVYNLLNENTELNFTANRRKPNRQTYNEYYEMLLENLNFKYTKSEIFVTLSFYFTDNIFNMFKILDKKHATIIILELKQKGYLEDIIGDFNFQ